MARAGTETVDRLRASGAPGRHGARAPENATPIEGCHMIPRTSSEEEGQSNTVIVGYTLVAPGGTDLEPSDRIRWRDDEYEIVGEPAQYEKRKRAVAVVAALKRASG